MMWEYIFIGVVFAAIVLPLLPGIMELGIASDAQPLKVIQEYDVSITHFARGFRAYLDKTFPGFFQQAGTGGIRSATGTLEGRKTYQIVGHGATVTFDPKEVSSNKTTQLVVAADSIVLPRGMSFESEIYSAGGIQTGSGSQFRAMLAERDISLADNNIVLRWIHSEASLYIATGSRLFGRASAGQNLVIAEFCQFERLNAPRVIFGKALAPKVRDYSKNRPVNLADICDVKDQYARRWLVNGDVKIPSGTVFEGDIVATRSVIIGEGCHIIGSIKSNKDLLLQSGVRVDGSVFSAENMTIEPNCQIQGPVVAEEDMVVKAGTVIGSEVLPTTLSALRMSIAPGVIVHGTIWADEFAAVNPTGDFHA